jgi:hypothetical protein
VAADFERDLTQWKAAQRYLTTGRNVMWCEPDEDDEQPWTPRLQELGESIVAQISPPQSVYARRQATARTAMAKRGQAANLCTGNVCRCGKGKQCAYWRAKSPERDTTTDPAVIAQVLWAESRELLAKVGVDLPAVPPAPARPMRWYRQPLVQRYVFFGVAPALIFGALLGLGIGEWPTAGALVIFLFGAFINYDLAVRTRLKPRHLTARMVAIVAVGVALGWLT